MGTTDKIYKLLGEIDYWVKEVVKENNGDFNHHDFSITAKVTRRYDKTKVEIKLGSIKPIPRQYVSDERERISDEEMKKILDFKFDSIRDDLARATAIRILKEISQSAEQTITEKVMDEIAKECNYYCYIPNFITSKMGPTLRAFGLRLIKITGGGQRTYRLYKKVKKAQSFGAIVKRKQKTRR